MKQTYTTRVREPRIEIVDETYQTKARSGLLARFLFGFFGFFEAPSFQGAPIERARGIARQLMAGVAKHPIAFVWFIALINFRRSAVVIALIVTALFWAATIRRVWLKVASVFRQWKEDYL